MEHGVLQPYFERRTGNNCSVDGARENIRHHKSLVFQGIPQLDFASSSPGMSLFIEAEGEAINQKGDILMLAEGMADRLSIKPTEVSGLQ